MATPHAPDARALLPLKPVVFQILMALIDRERHGYGLVQEIHSQWGVRLDAGNLYRALRAMLDEDLIEESERRPAPASDDERRRYYRVTPFGRRVAAAEAARLESLVAAARARRLLKERP
jgi:DNA-binding PadR family transcriptional regulator